MYKENSYIFKMILQIKNSFKNQFLMTFYSLSMN